MFSTERDVCASVVDLISPDTIVLDTMKVHEPRIYFMSYSFIVLWEIEWNFYLLEEGNENLHPILYDLLIVDIAVWW